MRTFVMYAACRMIIYPQKPSIIVHASLARAAKNAAGIHNWPRPLGSGLQYPGCSVGMHGVASHPSHLHHGADHHPLPCKTSAHNAVVPRWLGIANMRENGREKRVPRMRRWLSDLARDGPSRSGTASGRSCKIHRWSRGAGRLRMSRICST